VAEPARPHTKNTVDSCDLGPGLLCQIVVINGAYKKITSVAGTVVALDHISSDEGGWRLHRRKFLSDFIQG